MGILQSEVMKKGTLVVPQHRAHSIVDILGRNGNVQFVDMNEESLNRQYKKYINRIDEMERKLKVLYELINELTDVEIKCDHPEKFLNYDSLYRLEKVESTLDTLYSQFSRFKNNNEALIKEKNQTLEEKYVVQMAVKYLKLGTYGSMQDFVNPGETSRQALLSEENNAVNVVAATYTSSVPTPSFSTIAGVISVSDQKSFERVLFLTTRGNSYVLFEEVNDFNGKAIKEMSRSRIIAFVVYFQGTVRGTMEDKLRNICNSFDCRIYEWAFDLDEAEARLRDIQTRLEDKEKAVEAYEKYFKKEISVLLEIPQPSSNSLIEDWRLFSLKERSIYSVLDMFQGTNVTMRINCWFPAKAEVELKRILANELQQETTGAFFLLDESFDASDAPTYNKTSEVTDVFQALVDTYGVPRYREANPALFTIVTLPFLFGVMFGDIGHGLCLLTFGIYLLYRHKDWEKFGEIGIAIAWARYLLIMMGISAVYSGFMYNEFFSLGISIFGSRWTPSGKVGQIQTWELSQNSPYPFGTDPKWKGAMNELAYVNSFKMKFSIIVAYVHMMGGILLKGYNAIQFREPLDLLFQVIPQIVLFTCFTGYLSFLIIYKWITPLTYPKASIVATMIKLCLYKTLETTEIMIPGQQRLHEVILFCMISSIFLLLVPKPLYIWLKSQRDSWKYVRVPASSNTWDGNLIPDEKENEEEISELILHQLIEGVEFILGVVSNTASYLRLWALSLAHQQLSIIFLEYTVVAALKRDGLLSMIISLFFGVNVFALVTLGAVLGMDSIECFLHALRLQWVEFQNKFFKADGKKYTPFDLRKILTTPLD